MPHGPFKVSRRFGETCRLQLQIRRAPWFLTKLTFRPWRWRRYVPPKCQLAFKKLYAVISQKTELLLTSNPTHPNRFTCRRVCAMCRPGCIARAYSRSSYPSNFVTISHCACGSTVFQSVSIWPTLRCTSGEMSVSRESTASLYRFA
jgi:hypothetical protein